MAGWFPLFAPSGSFSTLKIGGGGFVTGFDFQLDGTALARTDTYGGYKLNRVSGLWEQLVTRQSMPSPDNGIDTIPTNQGGAYELVVAPTNTSRFYMVFNGYVFVTTNKGVNWTRSAFVQDLTSNTGDGYRTAGKFMAVDPNNELICYVGTPTKLSVTTDGGATWNPVAGGFTAPTDTSHDTYYLYNDGQRNSVDKGIWRSTDGGATWSHIYSGGFGGVTQNAIQLKAVPGQAGHLFVSVGNQRITHPASTQLWKSTDGGATWNPLANVSETFCVGFGKNAQGQSYPSIYIVGWVSGVYGLHRSIDAGSTWQKVGDGFPAGTLKPAYDCYGDMGIYGTVYLGTLGNGAYQGVNL